MNCNRRNLTIVLAFISLLISVSVLRAKGRTDRADRPVTAQTLLKERLAVLKEIAKLRRVAHEQGDESIDAVLAAEDQVAAAELELATVPAERIAALERLVTIAKDRERYVTANAEHNEASVIEPLSAKAFRLRAEANLISERSEKVH